MRCVHIAMQIPSSQVSSDDVGLALCVTAEWNRNLLTRYSVRVTMHSPKFKTKPDET